jgi:pimeloyl-ACP methyl ester carboxylesterase
MKKTMEPVVTLPAGGVLLEGNLELPNGAGSVVLFAHGSGSSRHSARNRFVASTLRQAGLGTFLFDLLSAKEEALDAATGHLRFDISLLASRLECAVDWIGNQLATKGLPIGLFGSSTGGAAALVTAAGRAAAVRAVVSRGGRPDLAGPALAGVRAPTLLIVGELDAEVLALNRRAAAHLRCENRLEIVPGATHLFEEPGALEEVARLAARWFSENLAKD